MNYRLTRLQLRELRIPFRMRFRHALAERREARNLIVALQASSGHVGYGEVVPRSYLTGETNESAWQDIVERWWPAVRELSFPLAESPLRTLRDVYLEADRHRRTASYAGIDVAIFDLWGRMTARPGCRLLAPAAPAQRLSFPIGGGGPAAVVRQARLGKRCGFAEFKLKCGRSDDDTRMQLARAVLGPHRDLRIDVNAGWTLQQALAYGPVLRRHGVSSIEQPLPAGEIENLARLQRDGGLPIMADESLCTREDAARLTEARAAQLWNIRLAKVGGFSGFLELCQLAAAAGVGVHHGVLVGESAVLAAAGRACSGVAAYVHVEFGFPRVLLRVQPFRGSPDGYCGIGRPLGADAGIGVQPQELLLERVTTRQIDLH